ncbi:MAG: urease accessory protein UreD [Leptolyngbya sp. DLM2.Bin15]|nr:MAG: urease accessory protein UreD [Leptolyngbya sp. DLM2.Bin15]
MVSQLDPSIHRPPSPQESLIYHPDGGLGAITDFDVYLRVQRDRYQQSFVSRQYATHPFRVSNVFRLDQEQVDQTQSDRAYVYLMNTSPGLMEGDRFRIGVQVDAQAHLYLTDQAATKVHRMPTPGRPATVDYILQVGAGGSLEFLPEPLILYHESTLNQRTQITLHPSARLCLSEIIVPGRLARQEYYQFNHYSSRLTVSSPDGRLILGDALRLEGRSHPFCHSPLFARQPILATLLLIYPDVEQTQFEAVLKQVCAEQPAATIEVSYSSLPNCNGFVIRATADCISRIKTCFDQAVNAVRLLEGQSPLPEVPK